MKLYLAGYAILTKCEAFWKLALNSCFIEKQQLFFDNSRYTIHSLNVYWMNCIML